jgi:(R,R)-butanediol dehydrogenase/meso-butanediol dehydrogenase/diacetyl reductase
MKGVTFLGNRECEVREYPVPEPAHGEVLIRIEATGICGSDLHVYRGSGSRGQISGHEPCGVVTEVGEGVVRLRPGHRVTVHHHQGCGVCHNCARGETVACPHDQVYGMGRPGSFAEFVAAGERNCIPLPDSVSFVDGAFMACVGGTAYGAFHRLGAVAHETVAVFGLGPVGLSCVLVGKAMGLRVVGVDIAPERVELATRCGADAALNGNEGDVVSAVRDFSQVRGVDWAQGIDYVIETSGSTTAREWILPSLRRGGKAAIVGVGSPDKVINPSDIHGRAATIIGSVVFPLGWMWDLARFLAASGMSFEPAVTHRFQLGDAPEALRMADEARCGKVLFVPEQE